MRRISVQSKVLYVELEVGAEGQIVIVRFSRDAPGTMIGRILSRERYGSGSKVHWSCHFTAPYDNLKFPDKTFATVWGAAEAMVKLWWKYGGAAKGAA